MVKAKVLITGGAGNIGGSLARRLTEQGTHEVIVIDNLQSGSTNKLPPESPGFISFGPT
jgi:UDP-glucuronate decarboxylase